MFGVELETRKEREYGGKLVPRYRIVEGQQGRENFKTFAMH